VGLDQCPLFHTQMSITLVHTTLLWFIHGSVALGF
jgi:hypothetical protein